MPTEEPRAAGQADFGDAGLLDALDGLAVASFDDLDFGLITMSRDGTVIGYNKFESHRAGLSPERVLGRNFFSEVGPCTDNHLVAGRFRAEGRLDHRMDYVFTFRTRVTPVELRLMAAEGSPRQYLAVRAR
jgi:photoactive yellow protein